MCRRSHEHFVLARTVMLLGQFTQTAWNLTCMSGSRHSSSPGLPLCGYPSRSYCCPVLHRHASIAGRLRVGSIQTGETGSHGTSKWRLKSLCLTTTTGPPTESLTPSPSLNPSKTLTNFLFNLAWHTGYPFLYFYIFVLLVHIRGSQTCCFQNTTTVADTQHPFH